MGGGEGVDKKKRTSSWFLILNLYHIAVINGAFEVPQISSDIFQLKTYSYFWSNLFYLIFQVISLTLYEANRLIVEPCWTFVCLTGFWIWRRHGVAVCYSVLWCRCKDTMPLWFWHSVKC